MTPTSSLCASTVRPSPRLSATCASAGRPPPGCRLAGEVEDQRAGGVLGLLDRDQQALGLEVEVLLEGAARDVGAGLVGRPFGELGAVPGRRVRIVDVDLGAEDVLVTDLGQRLVEHVLHRCRAAAVTGAVAWPAGRRGRRCGAAAATSAGAATTGAAVVRSRRPCPAGWCRTGPPSPSVSPSLIAVVRHRIGAERDLEVVRQPVEIGVRRRSGWCRSASRTDRSDRPASVSRTPRANVLGVLAQPGDPGDPGDAAGVTCRPTPSAASAIPSLSVSADSGSVWLRIASNPSVNPSASLSALSGIGAGQLFEIVGQPVGVGVGRRQRSTIVDGRVIVRGCRGRGGSTVVRVGISGRIGDHRRGRRGHGGSHPRGLKSAISRKERPCQSDRQDATANCGITRLQRQSSQMPW